METVNIEIDVKLAREYVRKYREIVKRTRPSSINFSKLLKAFVEDRLREEIEFLDAEGDASTK